MSILNRPFSNEVRDELLYRRSLQNLQIPLMTHLRVTSLVQGELPALRGQLLHGLTVGPIDSTDVFSFIEDHVNVSGHETAIGLTYTGGSPRIVKIPTNKWNLPSPGIESANVSVQTEGRTFMANVRLKCYGKEQYDFLYQTFCRPGTPILIEYGHTRDDGTIDFDGNLVDLSELNMPNGAFFKTLDDNTLAIYNQMSKGFRGPISKRHSESIVGLVSNFEMKLNNNNEYDIQLELINSLEWFYNLQNDDTFVSYGDDRYDSKSIRLSFGLGEGDDYKTDTDTIFKIVTDELSDTLKIYNDKSYNIPERPTKRTASVFLLKEGGIVDNLIEQSGRYNYENIRVQASSNKDDLYVSLDWFFNSLLNDILNTSYTDLNEVFLALQNKRNWFGENESYKAAMQLYDQAAESTRNNVKVILSPDSYHTYWNGLRSINSDVIFNNKNLYDTPSLKYSTYFLANRWKDYTKKYDINASNVKLHDDIKKFFTIDPTLGSDKLEIYGNQEFINTLTGNGDGARVPGFRGIYISYIKIRNAFLQSNTITEALVKILNLVNSASNGALNLKMRFVNVDPNDEIDDTSTTEGSYRKYELFVYDEASLPGAREAPENLYTFFEDDISEAIEYNLDFNMPAAVASIIVANEFKSKYSAGGDLKNKLFIDYGYDPGISKLFKFVDSPPDEELPKKPKMHEYAVNSKKDFKELWDAIPVGRSFMLGYLELNPPHMTGLLVKSGLNNTLPSAAKVTLTLQGIAGVRWGDLFKVKNILPDPYDEYGLFMTVGFQHDISPSGWITRIQGQLISTNPDTFVRPATATEFSVPSDQPESVSISDDVHEVARNTLQPEDSVSIMGLDPRWYPIIQSARLEFRKRGYTFGIISAVRSRTENTDVGGAPNSKHLTGRAIDVNIFEYTNGVIGRRIRKADALRGNDENARRLYYDLFHELQRAALRIQTPARVRWGGSFTIDDPNHYDI